MRTSEGMVVRGRIVERRKYFTSVWQARLPFGAHGLSRARARRVMFGSSWLIRVYIILLGGMTVGSRLCF